MSHVFPWAVLIGMAMVFRVLPAADPIPSADHSFALADGRCGYAAAGLKPGASIRVVLLGGSITLGAGASRVSSSYWWQVRTRMAAFAAANRCSMTVDQAAVGGTGSEFAAFRFSSHVLAKGIPDLLVVEFAVNDLASRHAAETLEGVVRQAWRANPRMGILLLYTANERMLTDSYAVGSIPASVAEHHRVALHYGLPEVHAGPVMQALVAAGEPVRSLLPDGVHPADRVHGLYAQLLGDAMEQAFKRCPPVDAPGALPAPLVSDDYAWARLEPLPEPPEGWQRIPPSFHAPMGQWEAAKDQARWLIPVCGDRVGFLFTRWKAGSMAMPGEAVKPVALVPRTDGVAAIHLPPRRQGGWDGNLTIQADQAGQIRLAGLLRILPVDERR